MSERKVLNKYYPPDFDPSKIPRMKLARNRQYTVRLMAPFNMRCKTCGEYIYKGKKFNARKEDVEGDDYLGIRIYRFYIKCTRCLQEISFKTDPKNTDYEIEAGATRNFMALKLAEEQAQREEDEEKEEEATNPMKLLEKRTQQSKQELELLESLEELKDLNRRQRTIDYDRMLAQYDTEAVQRRAIDNQEKIDEMYVKSVFGKERSVGTVVEEEIVELRNDESPESLKIVSKISNEGVPGRPSFGGSCDAQGSSSTERDNHKTTVPKRKTAPSLRATLGNLIKKKTKSETPSMSNSATSDSCVPSNLASSDVAEAPAHKNPTGEDEQRARSTVSCDKEKSVNGLSLLCAYSGSSDNEED